MKPLYPKTHICILIGINSTLSAIELKSLAVFLFASHRWLPASSLLFFCPKRQKQFNFYFLWSIAVCTSLWAKHTQGHMCSSGGRAPVGSKHDGTGQIYSAVLMRRRCGPGGICVAVTGSPSQMQELSISKASLSLLCFSFLVFSLPLLPGSIFTWRERIHKLWESNGAQALAALAFRGRTEISFMWRYDLVHVSCGN